MTAADPDTRSDDTTADDRAAQLGEARRDGHLDGPDDWRIGQDRYERQLARQWGER